MNSFGFVAARGKVALLMACVFAASAASPLSLSRSSLTFPAQSVGTPSATQTVTIGNTGDQPIAFSSIALVGQNSGDFALGGTCGSTLAAGSSCQLDVSFTPSAVGIRLANIAIAGNFAGSPQSVSLSGTGQVAVSALTASPNSDNFGFQNLNSTSASQFTSITNTGGAQVNFTSIGITGQNAADFALTGNSCGVSLPAGSSCYLYVTFSPASLGSRSAAITIAGNLAGSPLQVPLSGTGQAPLSALTINSSPLDFGTQNINIVGALATLTVNNTGTLPVNFSSIAIGGKNASDFAIANSTCQSPFGTGNYCFVDVTFTPIAVGPRSAVLSFTDSATGSPQTVALTGSGQAATATLQVSPPSLRLGGENVTVTSPAQSFTIANTGTTPITFGQISIVGANAADFAISDNFCTGSLPVSSNCSVSVTFTPKSVGPSSATVQIVDNANGSPQTVALSGIGLTTANLQFTPAALSFGNPKIGEVVNQTLTITNIGPVSASLSSLTVGGTDYADFAIAASTCLMGTAALSPGSSCSVTILFSPEAVGARSANLTISDNAARSPQVIFLGGQGAASTRTLAFQYLPIPFGNQTIGSASSPLAMAVTNTGNTTVNLNSIAVTGLNAGDFSIGENDCAGINSNLLPPNQSCSVYLTFTPTAAGARKASLTFVDNAVHSPQSVAITGNGVTPGAAASLSPIELAYGTQPVGTASAEQDISFQNSGSAVLSTSAIAITGKNAADFSITTHQCEMSPLQTPGQLCFVGVVFAPLATGARTANLRFTDDAAGSPQTVLLTGSGEPATKVLAAADPIVFFGGQAVGTTSAAQQYSVLNNGTATVNIGSATISGANAHDFAVASNLCSGPLPAGQQCSIAAVFSPTAAGNRAASLLLTSDAANSPLSVALNGAGISGGEVLSFFPATLSFSQATGQASAPQSVTLLNSGTADINISSISITGPADYSISSNSCPSVPTPLTSGNSCSILITYTPSAVGTSTATLGIASDAGNQAVSLKGAGQNPSEKLAVPASVTFSAQGTGIASLAQAITLQNNGTLPIFLSAFAITGKNSSDFSIDANSCPGSLEVAAACTIGVTFTPSTTGTRTAVLTITDDATGSPQSIALTGTGEASQKQLSLSATVLTLGVSDTGTATGSSAVQLTNTSSTSIAFSGYSISGANAADFKISQNTCQASFANVLPANGACSISVTFTPSAPGLRTAALQIADNASGSPQTISLNGSGESVVRAIALSQQPFNFGSAPLGSTTGPQGIPVINVGDAPVTFSSFTVSGPNAGDFILGSNPCIGSPLAPQNSCYLTATFIPSAAGRRQATLQIASNASGSPQSFLLEGSGQSTALSLSFSQPAYDFGVSNIGTGVVSSALNVSNTGNVVISGITIAGKNAADFTITDNVCGTSPQGSCFLLVTFTPSATGVRTATLSVSSNAPGSPQSMQLTGVGQAASKSLALSAISYDFGVSNVDITTAATSFYAQDTGTGVVTVQNVTISGKNAADFAISGNSCGALTPPYASCAVQVAFTPSAPGIRTATLTFIDDAPGSPQSIALTGEGQAVKTSVEVLPLNVVLTSPVGVASTSKYVYFNNTGTSTISFSSASITGANAADFVIASNSCLYNFSNTLAPDTSCAVGVTFTPSIGGAETATLSVTDSISATPQTIKLSGLGQNLEKFLQVSGDTLLFGMTPLFSLAQGSIALTTESTGAVTLSNLAITGVNASEFTIVSVEGCQTGTPFIGSCLIDVQFAPLAQGYRTATLQIFDDATGSTRNVILSGYGYLAEFILGTGTGFGSVPVNTLSTQSTVTFQNISNPGTAFALGSLAVVGPDASDFAITSSTCSGMLAAYSTCTANVTFKPSTAGPRIAAIELSGPGGSGPLADAMVAGDGEGGAGYIALQQLGLEFDDANVNTTSTFQNVQITNTGTDPVHFTAFNFVGTNAADFSLPSNGCQGDLAPGATCFLAIEFTPSGTGLRSAALQISSNAKNSPQTLGLIGAGQSATEVLYASSASLDFGSQNVNGGSSTSTIALGSADTSTITVSSIQITGPNAADFTFSYNNCGSVLNSGGDVATPDCFITLQFAPTANGPRTASLVVVSDAPGSPLTVPLTGVGQPDTTVISLSNVNLDFGVENIGAQNTMTVVATNQGTGPVQFGLPTITGANAGDFTIASNSCASVLAGVSIGGGCGITVAFTPSAAGSRTALLAIPSDAGSPQTVALFGAGQIKSQLLSFASNNFFDFGDQSVGASVSNSLFINNTGTDPAVISGMKISGANASDFRILPGGTSTCVSPLLYGCSITMQFTPSVVGIENAVLTVSYGSNSRLMIALVGEGLKPVQLLSVSPLAFDFGAQAMGSMSNVVFIGVSNIGDSSVNLYPPTITGAGAANFAISQNTCNIGSLAAGTLCGIFLTFTPAASGPVAATLQIPNSASSSPLTVLITGTGTLN
jgi:hypothetical protein